MLQLIRRALTAAIFGGVIAAVLRLRGSGGVAPQTGGWRELTDADVS